MFLNFDDYVGINWDMKKEEDKKIILVDLPGLKKENLNIEIEGIKIVLKLNQKKEDDKDEKYDRYYDDRYYFETYADDDLKGITAELKAGILKITIPKKEKEVKKIEIK